MLKKKVKIIYLIIVAVEYSIAIEAMENNKGNFNAKDTSQRYGSFKVCWNDVVRVKGYRPSLFSIASFTFICIGRLLTSSFVLYNVLVLFINLDVCVSFS